MAFPSVVWGSFGVNETEMISYPGGKCYIFRLKLADKKNTPYRLDKPLDFLSQRSIDRRKKQHLAIDSTDLPISPAYLSAISANQKIHIVGKSKWNNSVLIKCSHPNNAFHLSFRRSCDIYTNPNHAHFLYKNVSLPALNVSHLALLAFSYAFPQL